MKYSKVSTIALALILAVSCGGGSFASQLRLVLAASPPLIQSLPLSPALKSGLITDFTDMASGAATLGDCLNGATDKPTKLTCVEGFSSTVEVIIQRGRFGQANSPRLEQIMGLIRGIIASARIYYGAPARTTARAGTPVKPVTERTIKAQIEALKEAMQP